MNKVIIINGSSQCGKDTFINFFDELATVEVLNHSTIDNIRSAFTSLRYEGGRLKSRYRKLMADIKTFLIDYNDIPFTDTIEQYNTYDDFLTDFVMFIHCREPSEIKKLVDYFGDKCSTLLIKRNSTKIPDNDADRNVNNYDYDYIIFNVLGLKNLKREAKLLIETLGVGDAKED